MKSSQRGGGWFVKLGENARAPIAGVFLDLFVAARLADFFDHYRNPFRAETQMLGFVGDVVTPRHRTQGVVMLDRVLQPEMFAGKGVGLLSGKRGVAVERRKRLAHRVGLAGQTGGGGGGAERHELALAKHRMPRFVPR